MKELIISINPQEKHTISLQSLPFGDGLTLVKTDDEKIVPNASGADRIEKGPHQTILASIPKSKRQALADFILNAP